MHVYLELLVYLGDRQYMTATDSAAYLTFTSGGILLKYLYYIHYSSDNLISPVYDIPPTSGQALTQSTQYKHSTHHSMYSA
jgi:hypothetical protein